MSEKIKITKLKQDESIDTSENMFDSVDAYSGDHVTRILELSPSVPGTTVQYVKIRFGVNKSEGLFHMTPVKEGDYKVESEYYKGFKYYIESQSGIRYMPDSNGVFNITNSLVTPIKIVLHLIVEKYTVTDLEQANFMEDGQMFVWSK